MKKKILISSILIAGTAMLASCINESETTNELRIVENCNTANELCSFELTNAQVNRQTDMLGRTHTRTLSTAPLGAIQGDITWSAPTGTIAVATMVQDEGLTSCVDENGGDTCTPNGNPTAFTFPAGSNTVSVSGNITVDGKDFDLNLVSDKTVNTVATADSHTFPIGSEPVIPGGFTIQDVVEKFNEARDWAHADFTVVGQSWQITCDPGYEWLDDINPAWGEIKLSTIRRQAVFIQVFDDQIRVFADRNTNQTSNARQTFSIEFTAGCWPVS